MTRYQLWEDGKLVIDEDRPNLTRSPADVDAERDRRIDDGFYFDGVLYQARPMDRENIWHAGLNASVALTFKNKKVKDLKWHDGAGEFAWIAADNRLVPMDAATVIEFARAASNHHYAHVIAARSLKDRLASQTEPLDATEDRWWPPR